MLLHLKLMSRVNMANKTAVEVFNDFKDFVVDAFSFIEVNMKKVKTYEEAMVSFQMNAYEVTNAMSLLDTEHKLFSTAKRQHILFEPRQFVVNEETIESEGEIVDIQEHGTMMPIKDQVITFLEQPQVFSSIIKNQEESMR